MRDQIKALRALLKMDLRETPSCSAQAITGYRQHGHIIVEAIHAASDTLRA